MSTRLKYAIGLIVFAGVFAGCGTHGMIKKYTYHTTKAKLQWAVNKALAMDSTVQRSSKPKVWLSVTNMATGRTDTVPQKDYYNDGNNYVRVYVKYMNEQNEYIFRYYGDSAMWDTAEYASIFICYAYDKYGHGGSQGNGGINHDKKLKKELINVFDKMVVSKIDSMIWQKPVTETR